MLSVRRCFYSATRCSHAWKYDRTIKRHSLRLCHSRNTRGMQTLQRITSQQVQKDGEEEEFELDERIAAIQDKLLYCDYLEGMKLKLGFKRNTIARNMQQKEADNRKFEYVMNEPVLSVALKYLTEDKKDEPTHVDKLPEENLDVKPIQMPYASTDRFETKEIQEDSEKLTSKDKDVVLNENYKIMYEKYLEEAKLADSMKTKKTNLFTEPTNHSTVDLTSVRLPEDLSKVPPDWMTDYEEYDESIPEEPWRLDYGTPNPNSKISSVPCGGCGALLHCKDTAIPGYLPSELFMGRDNWDLKNMVCQRCHFLKNYNTALGVNVTSEEYPKLLKSIRHKKAAVILMVDLMDFPCSIWPGITSIIGEHRPMFVVGNKVDLLPQDSPKFLSHVQECLSQTLQDTGINRANIKHITLISSKTGFGVEELINKLHNIWKYNGDVYLIGCTNVGKSTLFNALLQSDYCKVQAVDLIQRATTSPWPGTTLNLLKFPILRPSGWRLHMRTQRLVAERRGKLAEQKLRRIQLSKTKDMHYATLIGHIGRTFYEEKPVEESLDIFKIGSTLGRKDQKKFGVNENDKIYKYSHWCYDTPGTIQPDQVLHLLTTDELVLTLPRTILIPRTFILKQKQTLFLAGLGRLDYLEGSLFMRCTVFASDELPVTICHSDDADEVYQKLLETEAFAVPFNDPERLKLWPELVSKTLEITGIDWNESAADVVLSSAGWVAVTPAREKQVVVRAWTPEGRGIYLRSPALLKHAVALRGRKSRDSPAYKRGLPVYKKH